MKKIYYDELTGCYNRRFLRYWIDNEIKRAKRFATQFSLIILDIDDFRYVNNNFGHLEGDKVLVAFSEFLRRNIREVDNLVRYGGDEFIILMPNTDERGTFELAHRIFDNLNGNIIVNHTLSCSIGFAVFPEDGTSVESLISQADCLMYEAKKSGKSRIGTRQRILKKLQIPSPVTIGREDEANWCLGQLNDYNTIFIAGEAGIGKTRLVFEIKELFEAHIMLRGNTYAALSSVPYHPFKNMLSELLNKDFNLVQRILKQLPSIYQSEIMKILPVGNIVKATQTGGMDKYRLYNAVTGFITNLSNFFVPTKTIIFVDDLHWLDPSSCELLDFLIRSINDSIKIFGAYRIEEIKNSHVSEYLALWAREKLYTQITLSPLNENQTTQLVKAIMGSVPQSATRYIYHESGGNPFYVEEIIRDLERQKKIYWSGKEWVFVKDFEITIPRSIEETIKRKLKFLDPEIHNFLKIGAVFGQEFTAEIIASASKRNVGQILDAIDELCRLGFIKESAPEHFFFSEDIVRQIVYKTISRRESMLFHRAVGETIEVIYHNVLSDFYEQLATHFTFANDAHKSLRYSKEAAMKAKDNYAHSVAIKFFENALKYEDDIEEIFKIKSSLADIYFLKGNYKAAIERLTTCMKINPNAYKIYEKLGKIYESMGDYKKSLKYRRAGLKMTQKTDAAYVFKSAIAWLYTLLGQHLRARRECEDMLKQKNHMSKQTLGDLHVILGIIYMEMRKYKKAELLFKNGLKIREALGDKQRIAACYLNLGVNYHKQFNIKLSEKYYHKALAIYEEIGYQESILLTINNIGALYTDYDLGKAEEYYLKALSQAKLIGSKRTIAYLYNNIGFINYNRLMYDQALLHYKQVLKLSKEINYREGIVKINLSLAAFYREKGMYKKSRSYLEKASHTARELNMKFLTVECMKEEIEYYLQTNQLKRAHGLSRKMLTLLKTERSINYKLDRLIYSAQIQAALKHYSEAHSYYKKAYNYVKSLPSCKISGEIFYLRGLAYKKEKRLKDALKMFLKANQIFKDIGNLRYLDKIEREIARTSA